MRIRHRSALWRWRTTGICQVGNQRSTTPLLTMIMKTLLPPSWRRRCVFLCACFSQLSACTMIVSNDSGCTYGYKAITTPSRFMKCAYFFSSTVSLQDTVRASISLKEILSTLISNSNQLHAACEHSPHGLLSHSCVRAKLDLGLPKIISALGCNSFWKVLQAYQVCTNLVGVIRISPKVSSTRHSDRKPSSYSK